MALPAESYVRLKYFQPTKDAVVGTGVLIVGADEVALRVGANIDGGKIQSIVGTFRVIYRYVKDDFLNGSTGTNTRVISAPLGAAFNQVVETGHTDDLLSFYITDEIYAQRNSHYLDRTFKACIDRLLEIAK